MGLEKKVIKREKNKFSIIIGAVIILVGALLSFSMYFVIQRSFFQIAVEHEKELMRIMESLGSQLVDYRLYGLKEETENFAKQYKETLLYGADEEKIALLSAVKPGEYRRSYCYQASNARYCGGLFYEDYITQLDLSEVWEGKTVLFSPDFDAEGNYILAVAAPVWQDEQAHAVGGILIEQLDGYCISDWISELFLALDLGTAYIIDGSGRNIATAREENYDWITTRYNSQELVKSDKSESTRTVARLEKYALDGRTGIDSYIWEGSTNYVAYGPLKEADWGFFVGFYGDKFQTYTHEITSISSRAACVMLAAFTLFSCSVIAVITRNLSKERRYNEILVQQKNEIEQQSLHIAASEERFRVAMQGSRDIILEYQFDTGEITCFYMGREIKSGRVGDSTLRKRIVGECCMDEDSFERFEEVMRAISKGLTSAECMISGDYGSGRKWYSLSVSSIPNGSRMSTRAVGILRDVTGEREAELDSLTRLLNKAAMTENVRKAMQKNPPETTSAFVMLDIDHFKTINDQYGHPVGDQVLCMIASLLKEIFPEPYLTGRFGGDEFSIYCPSNVDSQSLRNRLEQLLEDVRRIQVKEGENLEASLSIGVVIFRGEAVFEEIYKKTDAVLYEVKAAGRNGCHIYEKK